MSNSYLEVISLVERLHRQFLEVVKLELEGLRIHDINNVQAMMLFNIGDAEMTVGELTLRGCYLGSNVSYNVKKMVENGYLAHERSVHDRRSIHVRLLRDSLSAMHQRHDDFRTRSLPQTAQTSPHQVCQAKSRHFREAIRNRISTRTAPMTFGFCIMALSRKIRRRFAKR
jgi:DNA-binding MarR family transcriptional regulator